MEWQRHPLIVSKKPRHDFWRLWLLLLSLALLASGLLTVYPVHPPLLALSPLFACLVALLLRYCWFAEEWLLHYLQASRRAEADHLWQQWGERSFSALATPLLLPQGVAAKSLLANPADVPNAAPLPPLAQAQTLHQAQQWLMEQLQQQLPNLPDTLPITLLLLTDTHANEQDHYLASWQQCYQQHLKQPLAQCLLLSQLPYYTLQQWLSQTEDTLYLLVIHQYQGKGQYIDALGLLLLASDDISEKYQLKGPVIYKRPISLANQSPTLLDEFSQFSQIQPSSLDSHCCFIDQAALAAPLSVIMHSASQLPTPMRINSPICCANTLGPLGPVACWISAALASQACLLQQQSVLLFTQAGQNITLGNIMLGEQVK